MLLTTPRILSTWWPLAASWLLMGVEGPLVAAVIARFAEHEIHLAALGGVVIPLALVIESPIIMMLAASTALVRDLDSYWALRRFMATLALVLTVVHAIVAFTPLFDLVAGDILGVPEATLDPARIGLRIMLPWTWAIADRRFHQGLLIRYGRQHHVGIGTIVRLVGTTLPLTIGSMHGGIPGIVAAGSALSCGVLFEAAYARICARSVIRGPLSKAVSDAPPLRLGRLVRFYTPLAMSPLLALLALPIGAAGMARMPESLSSLAAWPALSGFSFLLRSVGVAFNEVVVRHADEDGGPRALGRFAWGAGLALVVVTLMFAATPLGTWWFGAMSGLDEELTALATAALWWMAAMPLLSFMHSYYQGLLVHAHRTRGISEAVAASLVTTAAVLQIGILTQALPGASMAIIALASGGLTQALWLAWRYARTRRDAVVDEVLTGDAPVRLG